MLRFLKRLLVLAALTGWCGSAFAFTLQGPLTTWMTARLGYLPPDYNAQLGGGPMNLGEEYRWNVDTVYYGFTPDFVTYFGQRGIQEIDKAFKILNSLPDVTSIDVDKYPLTSLRLNHQAVALGIADLKSVVLSVALEELGLTDPTRYVYTLRNRWTTPDPGGTTNFHIIRRNFEYVPATKRYQASSYINGVLWTYDRVSDIRDGSVSWVVTAPVDPLALYDGAVNAPVAGVQFSALGFWTGLTRDDVMGLKYLYDRNNWNVETPPANATLSLTGGNPWSVPAGTNTTGTNATTTGTNTFIANGIRSGIGKVTFVRADYDSMVGLFEAFTNTFPDTVISNRQEITQYLERPVVAPDILFNVRDLQGGDGDQAVPFFGTTLNQAWVNNDGTNGITGNYGPGNIPPGNGGPALTVELNGVNEILVNTFPLDNLDEASATRYLFWGSFDGTTNEPVLYPAGITMRDITERAFKRAQGSAWEVPPSVGTNTTDTGMTTGGTP